ncbi:8-amino-7-oxononanoate synthase [Methylocapsa palsarum]|uniref:Uncharacterized protein n=1 Tax=Methylocapsa palsarum TaxID=1612308 RepID=A0A1I4ARD1_9HYPH|nr:8-amino-7-oxononanoate synthase [Methylocapsa palsarum]SFK58833.1 hypothetical protein SAMN05444581_11156 [Methylocapsa palsarum]
MARSTVSIDPGHWEGRLSAVPRRVRKGETITLTTTLGHSHYGEVPYETNKEFYSFFNYTYAVDSDNRLTFGNRTNPAHKKLPDLPDGDYRIDVTITLKAGAHPPAPQFASGETPTAEEWAVLTTALSEPAGVDFVGSTTFDVVTRHYETESKVTLQRTFAGPTDDRALWTAIRNRTASIGFDRYQQFIDCIFSCNSGADINAFAGLGERCLDPLDRSDRRQLSIYGPSAYSVLKLATQLFLTLESGVVIREGEPEKAKILDIEKERIRLNDFSLDVPQLKSELQAYLGPADHLPYLDRIVQNLITLDGHRVDEVLPYCFGVLQHRLSSPSLIELIWSYWLEEGMLVQTMNAVARRFQNRRGSVNDPLKELEFDPLRPLNNLIWGYIQDEHNRLTVSRRAHEYLHHYGLPLMGKAVSDLDPADSRSKFIEGFHNLLGAAARFFREDSDTTIYADAFPLLNALKEVHLLLAEGAHNQFGDLTWTARAEMLTMQWMLARPEMKEFLRGRYMVPYQEGWMGAVDSMKKLQGWTDTTITHFYELAVTGERILLSIRYGDWSDIENIEDQAKNWARSCKPEIQRYIHGYRTVSGVDLAAEVTDSSDAASRYLQPSVLLQRRLMEQKSALPVRGQAEADLIAVRVSGQRMSAQRLADPRLAEPRLVDQRGQGQSRPGSAGRLKLPAYRKEI